MLRRSQRFGALALISFAFSLVGSFCAPGTFLNRLLAIALCSLLGFQSNACMAQLAEASDRAVAATPPAAFDSRIAPRGKPRKETSDGKDKGLFDSILGGITELALRNKIQDLAKDGAPVTVSTDNLYQKIETLPGGSFKPVLLDLRRAAANTVIPVGDYILPVRVFCMQHQAGSPSGHRYQLGRFGGKRQTVLQAFNRATTTLNKGKYSQAELQGVSWAIQAGVAYNDMPADMKAIIDVMIPDHKQELGRNTVAEIRHVWNDARRVLTNLPSIEDFLVGRLGDVGRVIVRLMGVQDTITSAGSDWRNLSSRFVTSEGEGSSGGVQSTPWSDLGNGIYGRFLTQGNYSTPGFLELRITGNSSGNKGLTQKEAKKDTSTATKSATAGQVHDIITSSVAVPEGNGSIQPLAMASEDDSWWSRNGTKVIVGAAGALVLACVLVTDGLCGLAGIAGEGAEITVTVAEADAVVGAEAAQIENAIQAALKSSIPGDVLEGQVANVIKQEGIEIQGFNKAIGSNASIGEIDVETSKAIIEVTTQSTGKLGQIQKIITNAEMNPSGKPVILYAPNYGGTAGRAITDAGAYIVRNEQELIQLLQNLGK